jgi:hypothetical protein
MFTNKYASTGVFVPVLWVAVSGAAIFIFPTTHLQKITFLRRTMNVG